MWVFLVFFFGKSRKSSLIRGILRPTQKVAFLTTPGARVQLWCKTQPNDLCDDPTDVSDLAMLLPPSGTSIDQTIFVSAVNKFTYGSYGLVNIMGTGAINLCG